MDTLIDFAWIQMGSLGSMIIVLLVIEVRPAQMAPPGCCKAVRLETECWDRLSAHAAHHSPTHSRAIHPGLHPAGSAGAGLGHGVPVFHHQGG